MTSDAEIIARARKKAKALYAADERIDLSEMIEQLADIAEKRGAVLESDSLYNWKRIGPEEREAIEEAIELLEDPGNEWDCEEIIQVLRGLIDIGDHIGEPTEMVSADRKPREPEA